MTKPVRLDDVARRARVAPAVVSRVLNEDATLRIRADTRARVLEAIAELEYVPDFAGQALSTRRRSAIGLVVPMVSSPLNGEILAGANDAAAARGYSVLLADSLLTADAGTAYPRLVREGRVDGLILQRNNAMTDDDVRAFLSGSFPGVVLNAALPNALGTVALDDERGIGIATRHLLELGHRDIGHLAGEPLTDTARRRAAAFDAALRRAGIEPRPEWTDVGGHDVASGAAGLRRLLGREPRPTAVVAANVIACVGALAAAREEGIAVPGDVSIVSFHDSWFADHVAPPLTAVRMPLRELGARSVEQLLRSIDGGPAESTVIREPAPRLVVRGSTTPA